MKHIIYYIEKNKNGFALVSVLATITALIFLTLLFKPARVQNLKADSCITAQPWYPTSEEIAELPWNESQEYDIVSDSELIESFDSPIISAEVNVPIHDETPYIHGVDYEACYQDSTFTITCHNPGNYSVKITLADSRLIILAIHCDAFINQAGDSCPSGPDRKIDIPPADLVIASTDGVTELFYPDAVKTDSIDEVRLAIIQRHNELGRPLRVILNYHGLPGRFYIGDDSIPGSVAHLCRGLRGKISSLYLISCCAGKGYNEADTDHLLNKLAYYLCPNEGCIEVYAWTEKMYSVGSGFGPFARGSYHAVNVNGILKKASYCGSQCHLCTPHESPQTWKVNFGRIYDSLYCSDCNENFDGDVYLQFTNPLTCRWDKLIRLCYSDEAHIILQDDQMGNWSLIVIFRRADRTFILVEYSLPYEEWNCDRVNTMRRTKTDGCPDCCVGWPEQISVIPLNFLPRPSPAPLRF